MVKNCISTFYVEEFYLFKKRNFCWVKDTNHKKVLENFMVKIGQQRHGRALQCTLSDDPSTFKRFDKRRHREVSQPNAVRY